MDRRTKVNIWLTTGLGGFIVLAVIGAAFWKPHPTWRIYLLHTAIILGGLSIVGLLAGTALAMFGFMHEAKRKSSRH